MWFFIGIISLYSILLLYFTYVWNRIVVHSNGEDFLKVSVIIPFRNEESKLPLLVHSFKCLDYPVDLVEFIFINDHSSDQSQTNLQQLLIDFPFTSQILSLPEAKTGKKEAILLAVTHTKSPIIISTDADCEVPANWIQIMQAPLHSNHIHLVSGNVVFKAKRFLDKLFQMEFAPLIGVGGVSIQLGKAGMANGANLAFRKKTFENLGVFNDNLHIPTGDDVFLLQKISETYPKGIVFQKESIVHTDPPANLLMFYHQRLRWASKWRAVSDNKDKFPAIAVWAFHLIYMVGIIGYVFEANYQAALVIFVIKMVSEYFFLFNILKSQLQSFNIFAFSILQVVYSFYVIIFGLMANFITYTWKGRIYGKHER